MPTFPGAVRQAVRHELHLRPHRPCNALHLRPLDALVCLYEPTYPGCLIALKPVGMFKMREEKGIDGKIICVPLYDPYSRERHRTTD